MTDSTPPRALEVILNRQPGSEVPPEVWWALVDHITDHGLPKQDADRLREHCVGRLLAERGSLMEEERRMVISLLGAASARDAGSAAVFTYLMFSEDEATANDASAARGVVPLPDAMMKRVLLRMSVNPRFSAELRRLSAFGAARIKVDAAPR